MTIIPLTSAYLCQNCDHVGEQATQCERCKSSAVFPLSVWVTPLTEASNDLDRNNSNRGR